jgi:signal transduction histidine kinase
MDPNAPMIVADRQQLRQVFLNLFTNASDAMPEGGTLTVRVKAIADNGLPIAESQSEIQDPKSKIVIEIADTGTGIAPEDLGKVLEPFYTTKPEGKGTGLGLPICKRIVQEHGGTLEILSEGVPGKGTTVRLTLPLGAGERPTVLEEE